MRRLTLCALAAAFALIALGGRASAYPQFQFSSGTTRCGQCHYSPAGGGLITSWGRDESGDTISRGGDGSFLHGLWAPPAWLALGADVRLAAIRNDVGGPEAPEYAAFPMQSDLYARLAFGENVSLYLEGGVRGDTRPADPSIAGRFGSIGDRLMSREHYLMWRTGSTGAYLRAGRFFAPYGLRFVEHTYYVRRYTGYDLYDETYTVSGGYVGEDWELHASLFTPPPASFPDALQSVGLRESGGAVYAEQRLAGMAAVALQARVGRSGEAFRTEAGAVGKLWLEPPRVLLLGEADFIRQQVSAASFSENQFVGFLGASFFPVRGLMVGFAYERYQEDLSVSGTARTGFDSQVNFFPWAHFELVLLGQYQIIGTGAASEGPSASLFMLQLHYYL
jgi:hypothetical protein